MARKSEIKLLKWLAVPYRRILSKRKRTRTRSSKIKLPPSYSFVEAVLEFLELDRASS